MIYMQARMYLPMWGRFASPDPARDQHFEQTQSWNIYSYVQNNPITHLDPDGRKIVVVGTADEKIAYRQAISYLNKDAGMRSVISGLKASRQTYTVKFNNKDDDHYSPRSREIQWDPGSALKVVDNSGKETGDVQSAALGLGHEMGHAEGDDKGKMGSGVVPNYGNGEEQRVIQGLESTAAGTLGEPTRTNHGGVPVQVGSPTASTVVATSTVNISAPSTLPPPRDPKLLEEIK